VELCHKRDKLRKAARKHRLSAHKALIRLEDSGASSNAVNQVKQAVDNLVATFNRAMSVYPTSCSSKARYLFHQSGNGNCTRGDFCAFSSDPLSDMIVNDVLNGEFESSISVSSEVETGDKLDVLMTFEAQSGIDPGRARDAAEMEKFNYNAKISKSKEIERVPYVTETMVKRCGVINHSNPKYMNCTFNLRVNPYYVDLIHRLSQLDIKCCYTSYVFGSPGFSDIPGYLKMLYLLKCPFFVCQDIHSIEKQMESLSSLCYSLSENELLQLLNFDVDFDKFLIVDEYVVKPCITSKAELLQHVDWLNKGYMFSKDSFTSPFMSKVNLPDFPDQRVITSYKIESQRQMSGSPSLMKEVSKAVSASTSVSKLLLDEQKKQTESVAKLQAKAKSDAQLKKNKDKQWKQTHDEKGNSGYYTSENGVRTFTPSKAWSPPGVRFN